jgi:hypothetical protein
MFLLWSVLLKLWIYLKVVLCFSCNDDLMYIDGGTINLFETKRNENICQKVRKFNFKPNFFLQLNSLKLSFITFFKVRLGLEF